MSAVLKKFRPPAQRASPFALCRGRLRCLHRHSFPCFETSLSFLRFFSFTPPPFLPVTVQLELFTTQSHLASSDTVFEHSLELHSTI